MDKRSKQTAQKRISVVDKRGRKGQDTGYASWDVTTTPSTCSLDRRNECGI
jgi:hypothetical protein